MGVMGDDSHLHAPEPSEKDAPVTRPVTQCARIAGLSTTFGWYFFEAIVASRLK